MPCPNCKSTTQSVRKSVRGKPCDSDWHRSGSSDSAEAFEARRTALEKRRKPGRGFQAHYAELAKMYYTRMRLPKKPPLRQLAGLIENVALTSPEPVKVGVWLPVSKKEAVLCDFAVAVTGQVYLIQRSSWKMEIADDYFERHPIRRVQF